jgi:hypothetical protein
MGRTGSGVGLGGQALEAVEAVVPCGHTVMGSGAGAGVGTGAGFGAGVGAGLGAGTGVAAGAVTTGVATAATRSQSAGAQALRVAMVMRAMSRRLIWRNSK